MERAFVHFLFLFLGASDRLHFLVEVDVSRPLGDGLPVLREVEVAGFGEVTALGHLIHEFLGGYNGYLPDSAFRSISPRFELCGVAGALLCLEGRRSVCGGLGGHLHIRGWGLTLFEVLGGCFYEFWLAAKR